MGMTGRVLHALHERKELAVLTALIALIMAGNGLVTPMLSIYAASFSASSTMIGLVISLFGFGRLVANIPSGLMCQHFGHRPMLAFGPAIIVIGSIGAAWTDSFAWLLLCRFIQGAGSGIYMTAAGTAMATISRPGQRGRTMSLYQGGQLLGLGLGPAIGGLLAAHMGFRAPFWAYALLCALASIVAWFMLDTKGHKSDVSIADDHRNKTSGSLANTALLKNPLFLLVCFVNFGVFFTRTVSQFLLIPLLGHDAYGMSVDRLGLALTLIAIANFAMLPLVGRLIDRWGAKQATILSTAATGLSLAVMAAGDTLLSFWVGLGLLGLAGGISGPAVAAYTADIAPKAGYGMAIALSRSFGDVGFLIGPLLIGLIDDLSGIGHRGGIFINAALMVVSAAAFLVQHPRARQIVPHIAEADHAVEPAKLPLLDASQHKNN